MKIKLNYKNNITSLLSKNILFKNELLNFFNEKFSIKGNCLDYDKQTLRQEKSILGIIYDYYLRFKLMENLNYDHILIQEELYLTVGYKAFKSFICFNTIMEEDNLDYLYNEYINKEFNDKELFNLCIRLSIYEEMYRTSFTLEEYGKTYNKERLYKEIIDLYNYSGLNFLKTKIENIEFNPKFNNQYISADGDIIINNTLIEIKSGIIKLNPIAQLLSYYCLNMMNSEKYKIDKIGILYPRYQFYIEYNLKECITNKELMIIFFKDSIIKKYFKVSKSLNKKDNHIRNKKVVSKRDKEKAYENKKKRISERRKEKRESKKKEHEERLNELLKI